MDLQGPLMGPSLPLPTRAYRHLPLFVLQGRPKVILLRHAEVRFVLLLYEAQVYGVLLLEAGGGRCGDGVIILWEGEGLDDVDV